MFLPNHGCPRPELPMTNVSMELQKRLQENPLEQ